VLYVGQNNKHKQTMISIKKPLIATLLSTIFGFGLFMTSRQIEEGIHHEYSGRRAGSQQAMAALAEELGPTGSLLVWLGATGASGLWLAISIKKRKMSGS
jgi:hypothetical protein